MTLRLLRGRNRAKAVVLCLAVASGSSACSGVAAVAKTGVVPAVGAESQYANVIGQIGGKYVSVSAILSNPNADPHSFEASPSVAGEVSAARLVVQNGLGYDTFMSTIEAASPNPGRRSSTSRRRSGCPTAPRTASLYDPDTMPAVARAITADLSSIDPPMPVISGPTW